MRKVKLQIQMTVDGFIAGANGEMDWMNFNWGDDVKNYISNLMENVDTLFLGKNLASGFVPHWTNLLEAEETDQESRNAARFMVETPKIVFSRTLSESPWPNTAIANGDLKQIVEAIKQKDGGDILLYGGGEIIRSMMKENLIDELHLFVNPTIIGKGMPIFNEIDQYVNFKLNKVEPFDCGIVALNYHLSV